MNVQSMLMTLIAIVFGFTSTYGVLRSRQIKRGAPARAGDRYLMAIMVSVLAVGCVLVAVFHL